MRSPLPDAVDDGSRPLVPDLRAKLGGFDRRQLGNAFVDLALDAEEFTHVIEKVAGELGDLYVDSLMPKDIRLFRDRAQNAFAPSTINGWLAVLRLALDQAVEEGWLSTNPARRTRALPTPKTQGRRAVSLGPDQFHSFVATTEAMAKCGAISPDIARMILVLAWTGCRISEIRALKWSSVKQDEIRVDRSVWQRIEKGTKQNEPRILPKVEPLRRALDEQRKWLIDNQHPGLESGLVFPANRKHALGGKTRRGVDEISWYRARSCLTKPVLATFAIHGHAAIRYS